MKFKTDIVLKINELRHKEINSPVHKKKYAMKRMTQELLKFLQP